MSWTSERAEPRRCPYTHLSFLLALAFSIGCADGDPAGPNRSDLSGLAGGEGASCSAENFALAFDGNADRVDLTSEPIGSPQSVTVEAWVRLDATGRTQFLVSNARSDFNDGFSLTVSTSNEPAFTVAASAVQKATAVGRALPLGEWHHVAGAYDADAGLVKLYVDGVEEGSVSFGHAVRYASGRDLRFASQVKSSRADERYLAGALDEVRIWSVARDAEALAREMAEAPPADADGLAGYWRMDEGEGATTADETDAANTGQLGGDPVWTEGPCGGDDGPIELVIDVKPGEDDGPAPINLRSKRIPVAIFASPDFAASEALDVRSLTFGRTGDEESLHIKPTGLPHCAPEDVDGDGLRDVVCHFETALTGLQAGDSEVVLKGATADGSPVVGSDAVRVF